MICPGCSKFPAFDASGEPELDLDVQFDKGNVAGKGEAAVAAVVVTGTARIVLTSECCGEECKETTFDVEIELVLPSPRPCECVEFHVSSESAEITDRSQATSRRTKKDGTVVEKAIPYRYQKRFYGVHVEVEVTCACDKTKLEGQFEDDVQASSMDEIG